MNRTGTQVITRALRIAKVLGADQTAPTFALNEGLSALQSLIDTWWSNPQLHVTGAVGMELPYFADLTSTVSVPTGLTEAIENHLAIILAAENGTEVAPIVHQRATEGLRTWRARIAAWQVPELKQEVGHAFGAPGTAGFNMTTGS